MFQRNSKYAFSSLVAISLVLGVSGLHRSHQKAEAPRKAGASSSFGLRTTANLTPVVSSTGLSSSLHLPLSFEENEGQVDPRVKFLAKGAGYEIFLTADGLTLSAPHPSTKSANSTAMQSDVERVSFVGVNPRLTVAGNEKLPGEVNYLVGERSKWHTNVPLYRQVEYRGIYPGVDVKYYGNAGRLENDFIIAPQRDPSEIALAISGAGVPRLSNGGEVLIKMPSGSCFELRKPRAYQTKGGEQRAVDVNYRLAGDRIRFAVGEYDRSRDLIIDPVVLYSTYLGGYTVLGDYGAAAYALATDSSGNIYVAGGEEDSKFPVTSGAIDQTSGGLGQGFITKIDPTGTTLVYSAVFQVSVTSIAIDSKGDAYAAAVRAVPGFPTTAGAFQPNALNTSAGDPLIFELNAAGNGFVYATYLGGSGEVGGWDSASGIAVDSNGNAYVTGTTISNDFPTMNAFQPTFGGGGSDGFITKINPTGTGLVYSTYLGGTDQDALSSIAVDASGDAYVSGYSYSTNFPTANAFQQSLNGAASHMSNAVITELNPSGSSLVYSTYLGGTGDADGTGITTDSAGNASVVGATFSCDFPLKNPFQTTCTTGPNGAGGFVAQFDATGSLNFSTYFGFSGSSSAEPTSVARDGSGNIYVGGVNFGGGQQISPVVPLMNPVDSNCSSAAFVSELNATGTSLLFSTCFGSPTISPGAEFNPTPQVAIDPSGNIYISGEAFPGLPVVNALDPVFLGGNTPEGDFALSAAFVAKIATTNAAAVGLAPAEVDFGNEPVGTTSSAQTVTLTDLGTISLAITSISPTGDFQETNNCGNSVAAGGGSCTINVTFTPTAAGSRTGGIGIVDNAAGNPQTIVLTGNGGVPTASVNPTSLTFSNVAVGSSSAPQTVTLTNGGTASLSINQISTTGQFTETNNCGTSLGLTTCQISVVFSPTSAGVQTGTLTVMDNAAGNPQTVPLSGNPPAPGFTITPGGGSSSTSATVTAGQTANYSLSLAGTNGFSGAVNFTCSGAPMYSSCAVSPNPANVSGTSALAVGVSVSTQAGSNVVPLRLRWPNTGARKELPPAAAISLALLISLLFIGRPRISRKGVLAGAALLFAMAVAAGCGGGSYTPPQNKTPAGQYTLAVTATSGSVTQSMNLSLTVN